MATYVKVDDVSMPVFDGTNYSSWKIRILRLLDRKECKAQAVREKTTADDATKWTKNDKSAQYFIIGAVSDKQLEYISDLDSAYKMMKKFDSLYQKTSSSLQMVRRTRLDNLKLRSYENVTSFFDDFEKAVNELKNAGAKMDEEEKLRYLLKALPSEFSYIADLIDVISDDQRNCEYVKSKVLVKCMEKENNKSESRQSSNAFAVNMQGKCFKCGESGHKFKDCRKGQNHQSRGRGAPRGRSTFPGSGGTGYNNYAAHQQRGGYYSRSLQRGGYHNRGQQRGGFSRGNYNNTAAPASQQGQRGIGDIFLAYNECEKVKVECNNNSVRDNFEMIDWILDSGCTDHIINTDKYFDEFSNLDIPKNVRLGDGKIIKATKVGTINSAFQAYNNYNNVTIKEVYYVKEMRQNLLSYGRITENCRIFSEGDKCNIYSQSSKNLITVANKMNNLYFLSCQVIRALNHEIVANTVKNEQITDKEIWHRRLGHVNFQYLNKLRKDKLVEGIPTKLSEEFVKCAICIESKMTNVPFKNNRTRANDILEIVHTDLNGPHATTGNNGEKYFLSFIDDFSKCAKIYCINSKSETYNYFVEYVNLMENKTGKKIKTLRCDNGKEYINKDIANFIKSKGIQLDPCPPYVHELNGVAERYNRSIMDTARCLLKEAKIDRRYWPEVVIAAAYLKNRTLANTIQYKTPYEIMFNKRPNIDHLKIYGSKVFVRQPEQLRKGKWSDKAQLGILVGYNENGYGVLVSGRIINARHVDIVEEGVKVICLDSDDENDRVETEQELSENEIVEKQNKHSPSSSRLDARCADEHLTVRRSERKRSPVQRYGLDNFESNFIYVHLVDSNVPNNFEEAINSNDSKNWQKAMDSEIDSLKINDTWELVDKPKDKEIINVKWVYKKKNRDTYKARLVVRGFEQKEHVDNVYSPVVKMQTLKLLLAYCCQNNLFIDQMDVETAFLNGKVKSEVYVNQPEGYIKDKNKVCKLKRSLYGLRESPRSWYDCFDKFIKSLGFAKSKYDYCLFVKEENGKIIYILLFVDDLLICCIDKDIVTKVKIELKKKFKMKDLGKIKTYIGIDIDYDMNNNIMTLSQEQYIENLADKYNLVKENLRFDTPMETNLKLQPAEEPDFKIKYRNLIGELLYISTGTRPDISFSVNYMSRFQGSYDKSHFDYALRILRYLYKTKHLKLTFSKNNKNDILDCMVDSDWAGDVVDRKSTTGYIVRLYGNVIYWRTRKQNSVTKSSTFAEYVALSEAVTDVIFFKNMLNETFKVETKDPIKVYEDNSGALTIAKYGNYTKNSKHIEVQYHYVNESYEKGLINVIKIKSENNLADIFTKSLRKYIFSRLRDKLNLL